MRDLSGRPVHNPTPLRNYHDLERRSAYMPNSYIITRMLADESVTEAKVDTDLLDKLDNASMVWALIFGG